MSAIVEDLAQLSGLSPIFARTVVKRAVERAGVEASSMRSADVEVVLPELERVLSVYLGPEKAGESIDAIRRTFRHKAP